MLRLDVEFRIYIYRYNFDSQFPQSYLQPKFEGFFGLISRFPIIIKIVTENVNLSENDGRPNLVKKPAALKKMTHVEL